MPAHQLAEPRLTPPLALAQGADVHAEGGRLPFRDLILRGDAAPASRACPFREYREDPFPAVFRVPAPVSRQRLHDPDAPALVTVSRRLVHRRPFGR